MVDTAHSTQSDTAEALREELAEILDGLTASDDLDEKIALQQRAYDLAYRALRVAGGVAALYALAPRFDDAGLFDGSDWAHPARLQPGLVGYALKTREGLGIEHLSQLRFVTIATGETAHPKVAPEEARRFLERVLALNLDNLFPATTEDLEEDAEVEPEPVQRLFQFVVDSLGGDGVMAHLVEEAERVLLTRPIQIARVRKMIDTAARSVAAWGRSEVAREAQLLVDALYGPTPLSRAEPDLDEYESALETMDDPALLLEADTMATSMRRTGLVCPHHAVLLRWANGRHRRVLTRALGLEAVGRVTADEHGELVQDLVEEAVCPATAQCLYGLSRLLERGVPFQPAVVRGLRDLIGLELLPDVSEKLLAGVDAEDPPTPQAILLAGVLSVLGQPLGVDQGDNPTCQSARAISLWAQVDPAWLLRLVRYAARDGNVVMRFEGQRISSRKVERGVAEHLHPELDPISLLLTPHLDRIYWEMSRRAVDRDEDEHKWVNPEFHGWWVHRGFAALIDETSRAISAPDGFVRRFYAAYHPEHNGGREVVVPQPCGVVMTNLHGTFIDWHAISIQRVEEDPTGVLRVYFYNPNHDKGQDWGQGIVTSTSDRGEVEGESSLPFHQFAARLYVFHYDTAELGDVSAVPDAEVARVVGLIRGGWGAGFPWTGESAAR